MCLMTLKRQQGVWLAEARRTEQEKVRDVRRAENLGFTLSHCWVFFYWADMS